MNSSAPHHSVVLSSNLLFRSTIATSAPLTTNAWLMTNPKPLAPPVTTPTLPSRLKLESVRLKWKPPRPCTGFDSGISLSSGYGTRMVLSVRECLPSCASEPSWPAVLYSWCSSPSSLELSRSRAVRETLNSRMVGKRVAAAAYVDVRTGAVDAFATCRSRLVLNIVSVLSDFAPKGQIEVEWDKEADSKQRRRGEVI